MLYSDWPRGAQSPSAGIRKRWEPRDDCKDDPNLECLAPNPSKSEKIYIKSDEDHMRLATTQNTGGEVVHNSSWLNSPTGEQDKPVIPCSPHLGSVESGVAGSSISPRHGSP